MKIGDSSKIDPQILKIKFPNTETKKEKAKVKHWKRLRSGLIRRRAE